MTIRASVLIVGLCLVAACQSTVNADVTRTSSRSPGVGTASMSGVWR